MSRMSERAADLDHALAVLDGHGMLAVWPKRPSPTDAANEAIEQIAYQLVSLQDAVNDGAFVSPEKRASLAAYVPMMQRMGVIS